MTTATFMFNSGISTSEGRFMTLDIKIFINTPMAHYDYMPVLLAVITQYIIEEYGIVEKTQQQRPFQNPKMYGLSQARQIFYNTLVQYLAIGVYIPTGLIPGLFRH